ncbi:unnamed protein product [Tenebrio molitor]|nr:unnamed protein product [Tenebrio molitor]
MYLQVFTLPVNNKQCKYDLFPRKTILCNNHMALMGPTGSN